MYINYTLEIYSINVHEWYVNAYVSMQKTNKKVFSESSKSQYWAKVTTAIISVNVHQLAQNHYGIYFWEHEKSLWMQLL